MSGSMDFAPRLRYVAPGKMEQQPTVMLAAEGTGGTRLKRRQLIEAEIAAYQGRLTARSDGAELAVFSGAIIALRAAQALQESAAVRNRGLAEGDRIALRVGVHIGEAAVEEDVVSGVGADIVRQVAALADAGGVTVSQPVYEQVHGHINVPLAPLGERDLGPSAGKTHIWQWTSAVTDTLDATGSSLAERAGAALQLGPAAGESDTGAAIGEPSEALPGTAPATADQSTAPPPDAASRGKRGALVSVSLLLAIALAGGYALFERRKQPDAMTAPSETTASLRAIPPDAASRAPAPDGGDTGAPSAENTAMPPAEDERADAPPERKPSAEPSRPPPSPNDGEAEGAGWRAATKDARAASRDADGFFEGGAPPATDTRPDDAVRSADATSTANPAAPGSEDRRARDTAPERLPPATPPDASTAVARSPATGATAAEPATAPKTRNGPPAQSATENKPTEPDRTAAVAPTEPEPAVPPKARPDGAGEPESPAAPDAAPRASVSDARAPRTTTGQSQFPAEACPGRPDLQDRAVRHRRWAAGQSPPDDPAVVGAVAIADGLNRAPAAQGGEAAPRIDLSLDFGFDLTEIGPTARAQLDEVAKALRAPRLADRRILIEGHTDAMGPDLYNLDLSRRRAGRVRRVLIAEYGIPAARLAARGRGETAPVASNDDLEGRRRNRRVTFINRDFDPCPEAAER